MVLLIGLIIVLSIAICYLIFQNLDFNGVIVKYGSIRMAKWYCKRNSFSDKMSREDYCRITREIKEVLSFYGGKIRYKVLNVARLNDYHIEKLKRELEKAKISFDIDEEGFFVIMTGEEKK